MRKTNLNGEVGEKLVERTSLGKVLKRRSLSMIAYCSVYVVLVANTCKHYIWFLSGKITTRRVWYYLFICKLRVYIWPFGYREKQYEVVTYEFIKYLGSYIEFFRSEVFFWCPSAIMFCSNAVGHVTVDYISMS